MHVRIALDDLPNDPELLRQLVRDMAAVVGEREGEIERLEAIIQQLQRAQYGRRSERMDPDQLALALEDLNADIATAEAKKPVAAKASAEPARRRALPDHLPREDVCLDVDVHTCPHCQGAIHAIGESVSEMLDWVPAQLRVLRITRPKYACRTCKSVVQVPAPERPIGGGLATPALLAQVLVSKYCDHTPLYRQSKIFARHGVDIDRSTLSGWVGGAAWWLEALHRRLADHVMATDHLFADDTPMPVLDPGRGRTKTGRLWAYVRDDRSWNGPDPPAALYIYEPDRKGERPEAHLRQFKGVLQVDGYAGYERLTAKGDIRLAACWAHVRRRFYEIAEATKAPIALDALNRIGELYLVEAAVRGQNPSLRRAARQERSRHLVTSLREWMERQLMRVPPRGRIAEAVRYALGRWDDLCLYLDNGCLDIDNNPVERAIRPVALGRKNHLFAGSDGGGERWAMIASLIETAKLNGIEPYEWLRSALEKMVRGHPMSRLDDLLPWAWGSVRRAPS